MQRLYANRSSLATETESSDAAKKKAEKDKTAKPKKTSQKEKQPTAPQEKSEKGKDYLALRNMIMQDSQSQDKEGPKVLIIFETIISFSIN